MWTGLRLCLAAGAMMLPSSAKAVGITEIPFEEQVRQADLVVVARRSASAPKLDSSARLTLLEMTVSHALKGDRNIRRLNLVVDGSIAELRPMCCKRGKTYILLLKHGWDDIYEVVNGRFSAIRLE